MKGNISEIGRSLLIKIKQEKKMCHAINFAHNKRKKKTGTFSVYKDFPLFYSRHDHFLCCILYIMVYDSMHKYQIPTVKRMCFHV